MRRPILSAAVCLVRRGHKRRDDPNGHASVFHPRATHSRPIFEPELRRRGHATDARALAFSSPRARWSVAHWPPPIQQQPSPASFVADAAAHFCRRLFQLPPPPHPPSNAAPPPRCPPPPFCRRGANCFPPPLPPPHSRPRPRSRLAAPARSSPARSSDAGPLVGRRQGS